MSNLEIQAKQLRAAINDQNAAQIMEAAQVLASVAASPDGDRELYSTFVDIAEQAKEVATR